MKYMYASSENVRLIVSIVIKGAGLCSYSEKCFPLLIYRSLIIDDCWWHNHIMIDFIYPNGVLTRINNYDYNNNKIRDRKKSKQTDKRRLMHTHNVRRGSQRRWGKKMKGLAYDGLTFFDTSPQNTLSKCNLLFAHKISYFKWKCMNYQKLSTMLDFIFKCDGE